ncbi:MAG: alcohol dehydrogenase catalytic domain-containing protein [Spongiibacteraceae bacterium]|nr:alcohol dehydrogenase catalytic domain-containing protein [Spongiibacteraceae bacterium]
MLAARLLGEKNVAISNIDKPQPGTGEVLIRMTRIGLCGSDIHIFSGNRQVNYPITMGHEGIGFVAELGEGVNHLSINQRVVIEPNFSCGTCTLCKTGRGNICEHKRSIGVTDDGCFSEYAVIPADYAWPLPDTMSDDHAVLIEPTAVAVHALKISGAQPGTTIAIMGLGTIGLILALLARRLGYQVLAMDLDDKKCALAAAEGVRIFQYHNDEELSTLWAQAEVCSIFECAGSAKTATLATQAAPRGANVILVGLCDQPVTYSPLQLTRRGVSIIPSMIYDHPSDFARTITLMEQIIIDPEKIISGRYPLSQVEQALTRALKGKDTKLVIELN